MLDHHGKDNECIMVVGHNPSIEYLAFNLSEEFYEYVPTCTVIGVEFDVDNWKDIDARTGKISLYEYPKKYKD